MRNELNIIDFHNHHIPARFEEVVVRASPATKHVRWKTFARRLSHENDGWGQAHLGRPVCSAQLGEHKTHPMINRDWR